MPWLGFLLAWDLLKMQTKATSRGWSMTGGKWCYSLAGCYAGSDDSKVYSAFIHFKPHSFSMRYCDLCFAYLALTLSWLTAVPRAAEAKLATWAVCLSTWLMEKRSCRDAVRDAKSVSLLFLLCLQRSRDQQGGWWHLFCSSDHFAIGLTRKGSQHITWSTGPRRNHLAWPWAWAELSLPWPWTRRSCAAVVSLLSLLT